MQVDRSARSDSRFCTGLAGASLLLLLVAGAVLLPGATSAASGLIAADGVQCQIQQGDTPTLYKVGVMYNAAAGSAPLNAATVQPADASNVITGIEWNNQQGKETGGRGRLDPLSVGAPARWWYHDRGDGDDSAPAG